MIEVKNLQDLKILLDLIGVKYELEESNSQKIIFTEKGGLSISGKKMDLGEIYLLLKVLEGRGLLKRVEKEENKIIVEPESLSFEF